MDGELSTVDPDDLLLDLVPTNSSRGGATFVAILSKGGDSAPSSEEIPAEAPVKSAAAGVEAAGEAAGVTAGAEAPATTEKAPAAAAAATPEEAEAGAPAPSSASPAVPSTAAAAALVSSPLPLPVADQAAPTKLHTAAHRSPVASYAPTAVAASAASAARDAHAASDARDAAAVPGASGGNTEADGTDHNDSSDGDDDVICLGCLPASSASPSRKKPRVTLSMGSSAGESVDLSGGPASANDKMLDDFEELEEGQRSILRGGTRVRDVLSGLAKTGSTWWRHVAKNGMTASGFTHQIPAIRCYHGRTSSSIVKSSKALDTQFAQDKPSSMDVSGTNISTPLMKTLVNADIFVGPDA